MAVSVKPVCVLGNRLRCSGWVVLIATGRSTGDPIWRHVAASGGECPSAPGAPPLERSDAFPRSRTGHCVFAEGVRARVTREARQPGRGRLAPDEEFRGGSRIVKRFSSAAWSRRCPVAAARTRPAIALAAEPAWTATATWWASERALGWTGLLVPRSSSRHQYFQFSLTSNRRGRAEEVLNRVLRGPGRRAWTGADKLPLVTCRMTNTHKPAACVVIDKPHFMRILP